MKQTESRVGPLGIRGGGVVEGTGRGGRNPGKFRRRTPSEKLNDRGCITFWGLTFHQIVQKSLQILLGV